MANQNYEVLRLGPFTGGLNRAADPVVVEDAELVDCINLELDIDGSLVSRPAIQIIDQGTVDDRLLIFGRVELDDVNYLFATRSGNTFVSSDGGFIWNQLGTSRECKSMAVYQNTVWLPATPTSINGGLSWTPAGGAVAVLDMPRGNNCVVHKNRLYIVPGEDALSNESRLEFSEAGNFTIWSGSGSPGSSGFIDVAQGDGTTLNNLIVYQDNLLLFKEDSTFVLAYDIDPVDAILREINPVVGSNGHFGIVQHENTVYCLHSNNVYEIVNFNFGLLNLKVPFEFENSLPINTDTRHEPQHLSLLGDRLVVRFFNRTYVFGLRTRTWSEWSKTDATETIEWHIFGPLVLVQTQTGTGIREYITSYSFDMTDTTGYKVIRILDGRTVGGIEGFGDNVFDCIATTKDYDMADPVRYKRLFWWGADLITGNEIVADLSPITVIFSPTWQQLENLTWNDLNTWGQPLSEASSTQTIVPADNVFNTNKMVKFLKSQRFRKANFSVKLVTDGTVSQPTKIFSYVALVRTKQFVSAQVT